MTPVEWLERAIIKPVPGSVVRRRMIDIIDDVEYVFIWDVGGTIAMQGRFFEGNADDTFRL